jgi:hypothetical protein
LTLNIKQHGVKFHLYSVPMKEVQETQKSIWIKKFWKFLINKTLAF